MTFPRYTSEGMAPRAFGHLEPGRRYRITETFTDWRGETCSMGDTWRFITCGFVVYDEVHWLFALNEDGSEFPITLCWNYEQHRPIIESPERYFHAAEE